METSSQGVLKPFRLQHNRGLREEYFDMRQTFTTLFTAFLLLGMWTTQVSAQERVTSKVPSEYESVVSAVQKVMGLLQDVTQRHATEPISNQILSISNRLTLAGPVTGGFRGAIPEEDLVEMLREIERELKSIVRALDRRGEDDLSRRLEIYLMIWTMPSIRLATTFEFLADLSIATKFAKGKNALQYVRVMTGGGMTTTDGKTEVIVGETAATSGGTTIWIGARARMLSPES